MMELIRSIVTSVTEGVIKRFSGTGRPGESFRNREYFQHYGFTSRPKAGAEAIALKKGNKVIVIASDDRRYRIEIAEGEAALYTDEGDFVHLKRGREIHVSAGNKAVVSAPVVTVDATTKAEISAPAVTLKAAAISMEAYQGADPTATLVGNLELTGQLTVTGNISATGTIMDGGGNTNHHSHD